jgi:hypothetical protein
MLRTDDMITANWNYQIRKDHKDTLLIYASKTGMSFHHWENRIAAGPSRSLRRGKKMGGIDFYLSRPPFTKPALLQA